MSILKRSFVIVVLAVTAFVIPTTTQMAAAQIYNGQLDLTNRVYPVTVPGTNVSGDAAGDFARIAFDSGAGGVYDLTLTASVYSGNYNNSFGMLAFGISDDPQDHLVNDPSLFIPLATAPDLDAAIASLFNGMYWIVYNVQPGSTVSLNDYFTDPLTLNANTTYYAFVAAGSLSSSTLDYTLDVSSVPLPGALLLFTSGLAGLIGIRRKMQK